MLCSPPPSNCKVSWERNVARGAQPQAAPAAPTAAAAAACSAARHSVTCARLRITCRHRPSATARRVKATARDTRLLAQCRCGIAHTSAAVGAAAHAAAGTPQLRAENTGKNGQPAPQRMQLACKQQECFGESAVHDLNAREATPTLNAHKQCAVNAHCAGCLRWASSSARLATLQQAPAHPLPARPCTIIVG